MKLSKRMRKFREEPWEPKPPETVEEADLMWAQSLEVFEIEVAALEAKLKAIVSECEKPENRGRMTQKQQAAFLDQLRSVALAATQKE